MINQHNRPPPAPLHPPAQLRSTNMSTFSSTNSSASSFSRQHQNPNQNEQYLHYATPRHFINTSNSNEKQPPLPPPPLPTSSSLLESSGSFSTNCFSSSFAANDRISDSLDAKFLNKLCEEIEVSLNVDCECADDYSSNDFSGDYSFDHELIKQQQQQYSPIAPIKYNQMANANHMKNYLNGNLKSTNGGMIMFQKNGQQQQQPPRPILHQESNSISSSGQNSTQNNNNNSGKSHLGVLV